MLARLQPVAVPSNVRPKVAPVIVPALDKIIFPEFATTLLALPRVINPLYVAGDALLFVKAPPLEIPDPLSVSVSAVPRVNPLRSSAAPVAETVVPLPVVPKGVLVAPPVAPSLSVPALMVVKPVYVL